MTAPDLETTMDLVLERKDQPDDTATYGDVAMVAPDVDHDYWTYRVMLTETQAVVGFPKFTTVGVGFAVEDASWNTNLPYTSSTDKILNHILRNKGDERIDDADVRAAIVLIQQAAAADRETATQPV